MNMRVMLSFFLTAVCFAASVRDNPPSRRWALILDAPASVTLSSSARMAADSTAAARIEAEQRSLRAALAERKIPVTGSVQTLMNAVFVEAGPERAAELRSLPGVRLAVPMRRLRRHLDAAIDLVNARTAWNAVGGMQNAGAGVKIGIIDTGIDQDHPAFVDGSLTPPAGFPKCSGDDCKYTNKKVIVARSYVSMLTSSSNPQWSRPDDLSPRDRSGHGTAVAMVAAGNNASGPVAGIVGVAPKAFLGNYKVAGSPGVNEWPYEDTIITALNDAYTDGMDMVVLPYGWPAYYGPLDHAPTCSGTGACDLLADAVETAVRGGMLVVVSAGNSGGDGYSYPSLNTISSPGTAPSALTVGASTNSHIFFSSVKVTGSGVPSNLNQIDALFGNGPKLTTPLTAPLRDVAKLQNDGTACAALPTGSLAGAIGLVQRGVCAFSDKVLNAQAAGAVGVVVYQIEGYDSLFYPGSLENTGIPLAFIGNTAGKNLKTFLASNPDRAVTLDPAIYARNAEYDTVADFTSRGPATGTNAIKPEVMAVGTDMYLATQKYDPNGGLWDPSGYTVAAGTSFAAPMVAGAAALAKQRNPKLTAAQLKSLAVNTASDTIDEYLDRGWVAAPVTSMGAGKLNAAEAVKDNVAVSPTTVSFGVLSGSALPNPVSLEFSNPTSAAVNLTLTVQPFQPDGKASVTLDKSSLSLAAGGTATVVVRLQGSFPSIGSYQGFISVTGGASTLHIPYLYIVSDGTPHDLIPLGGDGFLDLPGGGDYYQQFVYKVVDQYGAPVKDVPVKFTPVRGGGSIAAADEKTDIYGIAAANALPGSQIGEQEFTVEAGNMKLSLFGRTRNRPAIATGGVVNAASQRVDQGLAPGSYISIYGSDLSDSTRAFTTPYLPLALAQVSVSFDVPSRSISVPGRLHFVSPNQVNVQIPWELQGLTSAQMKVSFSNLSSVVYTVPLNDYSPACFEYTEPGTNRLLAAALDERYQLVTSTNAVARGHVVQLYVNGLGPVDDATRPASGEPAPAQQLVWTKVKPTVTIGGKPAPDVQFWGLAPTYVGLYQLNVVVPNDAPTGIQPVVITANGVTSKAANLPVQ
jgi:uncharacterized protein (TIGR03437 family)